MTANPFAALLMTTAYQRIIPLRLDGWTCSRCSSTWSYYFHECPNCDAVTDGMEDRPYVN